MEMKIRKLFGLGLMAVALMASPVRAQDGAPDAKPEARTVAAVKTLNTEKQVTLLYVKGMT
jgi:hypothetical protein|tara:strand:+ start:68 stop:250 length:183 start_codon:yes stop_codon:yes gene_type:complete